MHDFSRRHPGTQHFVPLFAFDHLPPHLQIVSEASHDLAEQMILITPDGPELTAGLRYLLCAKDCFVRANGVARPAQTPPPGR